MKGTFVFALAIFASAFLLFLVQPMVGKRILPWFGGGPGVWSLCLMFYQSALFLGYVYAHALVRWASPPTQLVIHGLAVVGAVLLLPVLPGDYWRPGGFDDPDGSILRILFANVALPFMVLAATGPLVQVWFSCRHPDRSPYPLYAVSNIGSLLALLAYPFVIEPRLELSLTSTLWGFAFAACGVVVLTCGFLARRAVFTERTLVPSEGRPTDRLVVALWLLLPAAAVVVLMAVTNRLCLDIASVPFLWVLPLGIYLVSFIICFGSEGAYRRPPFMLAALLLFLLEYVQPTLGALPASWLAAVNSIYGQIVLNCLLLFTVCMVVHGELYRLRPSPQILTTFYLCLSGGGALGGIFVGIVAPHVFDGYYELPIGLGCAGVFVLVAWGLDPRSILRFGAPRWRWALAAPAALAAFVALGASALREPDMLIHIERNFFGILRVFEYNPHNPKALNHVLTHGSTKHGEQYQHPSKRNIPTAYFGPAAGIGISFGSRQPGVPLHVGIVGLGAGTLAAYGRAGDRFRFYELDPDVIRLAQDEAFFSFLGGSAAQIEVVPGDARLSLRAELEAGERQEFDVLVLDAFSSDAIPVHLLTVEAFALYVEHLREGGLIAAHLSNRHLLLTPIVARLGQRHEMEAMTVKNFDLGTAAKSLVARWMILSSDPGRLEAVRDYGRRYYNAKGIAFKAIRFHTFRDRVLERAPVWTDDYSDLFSVLKPLSP